MLGQLIGPYRIVRLIGQGGMGNVFEATNESIERRAAIKILHAEFALQPAVVTRFFNEARATNRIAHPGIVQIHDNGYLPDGTAYIIMELLTGETLAQRLQRHRLSLRAALSIGWQIADALCAAHDKGIIHRDLKPGNLMLVPDALGPCGERVKVLDFGIAKLLADAHQGNTAANVVMGTPAYMAPEQCRGAGEVDAQADAYSLGCIMYEMLAGRPPFVAEGAGELIGMHLFQEILALDALAPSLPRELSGLVHSLLRKDRRERTSMQEAGRSLRALEEQRGSTSDPGVADETRLLRSQQGQITTRLPSAVGSAPAPGVPLQANAKLAPVKNSTITRSPGQSQPRRGTRASRATLLTVGSCALVFGGLWELFGSLSDRVVPASKELATADSLRGAERDPHGPGPLLPAPSAEPPTKPPAAIDIASEEQGASRRAATHRSAPRARTELPSRGKVRAPAAQRTNGAHGLGDTETKILGQTVPNEEPATAVIVPAPPLLPERLSPPPRAAESAQRLYEQGKDEEAIAAGHLEADGDVKEAWRTVGLAACRSQNAAAANEAYHLAERRIKTEIEAACRRNGYRMLNGAFRLIQ